MIDYEDVGKGFAIEWEHTGYGDDYILSATLCFRYSDESGTKMIPVIKVCHIGIDSHTQACVARRMKVSIINELEDVIESIKSGGNNLKRKE